MSGQECWPECDWSQVTVEIYDSATAAAGECLTTYGLDMYFCPKFRNAYTALTASRTRCETGAGRFRLIPTAALNRDGDDRVSFRMQPVLVEGSGQLTDSAWFTRIALTHPLDQAVRAMGPGVAVGFFDEHDAFAAGALPHVVVDSVGANLTVGMLAGSAPFLVEQFSASAAPDFTFDAEWTCSDADTETAPDEQPTYSFAIADLDCLVDWPQRVAVRLPPAGVAGRMRIELDGLPAGRTWVPTTPTQEGDAFTVDRRGFRVSGAILQEGLAGAPSVRIDEVSYRGIPVCTPATLRLGQ